MQSISAYRENGREVFGVCARLAEHACKVFAGIPRGAGISGKFSLDFRSPRNYSKSFTGYFRKLRRYPVKLFKGLRSARKSRKYDAGKNRSSRVSRKR